MCVSNRGRTNCTNNTPELCNEDCFSWQPPVSPATHKQHSKTKGCFSWQPPVSQATCWRSWLLAERLSCSGCGVKLTSQSSASAAVFWMKGSRGLYTFSWYSGFWWTWNGDISALLQLSWRVSWARKRHSTQQAHVKAVILKKCSSHSGSAFSEKGEYFFGQQNTRGPHLKDASQGRTCRSLTLENLQPLTVGIRFFCEKRTSLWHLQNSCSRTWFYLLHYAKVRVFSVSTCEQ